MTYVIAFYVTRPGDPDDRLLGRYESGSPPHVPREGEFFRFVDPHPPNMPTDHREVCGWVRDVTTSWYGTRIHVDVGILERAHLRETREEALARVAASVAAGVRPETVTGSTKKRGVTVVKVDGRTVVSCGSVAVVAQSDGSTVLSFSGWREDDGRLVGTPEQASELADALALAGCASAERGGVTVHQGSVSGAGATGVVVG